MTQDEVELMAFLEDPSYAGPEAEAAATKMQAAARGHRHRKVGLITSSRRSTYTIAWSVSEYVFGVRTSKLTHHLGVKYLSTYSKEYVKHTRH
jgi:hypothetical protein